MISKYQEKINKALRHIDANLDQDINVSDLAKESGFSLYHFHRIYKAIVSETPYESLLRLRLEKSVFFLKYRKNLKISEVAYESGFSSPENFTRQFKARYKISPSVFRKDKNLHNSRIYQERNPTDFYISIENSRKLSKIDFEVKIEMLPPIPIAFAKAIFGSDGSALVEKYLYLMEWARKNKINIKGPLTRFGMSIDNPEVTPASKYRYDFAISIGSMNPALDREIELGTIPKANYATIHVKGGLEKVAQAWDYLYQEFLPNSAYIPLHYPAIEEFIQGPEEIGWDNFNIKCRVPIIKQS